MEGYIHSIESFGTVDGPGVRFVVFFQGCPMRCLYCHNPDTWQIADGQSMDSEEIIRKLTRNKEFYTSGGLTVTGGEPMYQMDFLLDLFERAKEQEIHTCLDTSGIMFREEDAAFMEKLERLLTVTDLIMLDLKHIDDEEHRKLTGHSNRPILAFAEYLNKKKQPVWIRHVVVPEITFRQDELEALGAYLKNLSNIEKLEILPYHAMGAVKYENLGMEYLLKNTPQLTKEEALWAENIIKEAMK